MAKILVVDPRGSSSDSITLCRGGHDVVVSSSGRGALNTVEEGDFDLVVSELELGDMKAGELVRSIEALGLSLPFVVVTAFGTVESAVATMQQGAAHYLRKPCTETELLDAVDGVLQQVGGMPLPVIAPVQTQVAGDTVSPPANGIIGRSAVLSELLGLVAKVAATDSTVLISGETGTGKELVGRALHQQSSRRDRVFSAVNSAAFPETLLESELFGHRRGAFTGASSNKKGLFELAHHGTVFMDEVAEMPASMQAKLLRFLQTGEIRPVGGDATRYVDVRLIAASNKDLEREVSEGRFREDLYYRLAVIPLHVPALRDRGEDIPLLVEHFLRRFGSRLGKSNLSIESSAMDRLMTYDWPGNVRQLENSIERGVALCQGSQIGVDDLPLQIRQRRLVRREESVQSLQMIERSHILNTLDRVGWNRKRAAELLEISTTTLWRRLKEFGIETGPRGGPPAGGPRPFRPSQYPSDAVVLAGRE